MREKNEEPLLPALRRGRSFPLGLVTLVLGLGGAGAAGYLLVSHGSSSGPALQRLAGAVGDYRVIRPRLTGGFAHASCGWPDDANQPVATPVCRKDAHGSPPARLLDLGRELRGDTAPDIAREALHARGLFYLLWPDQPSSIDDAVAQLRSLANADPDNAAVLNDLAVAHLVRAEVLEQPEDLVVAVSLVDSAVALESELREARFNRALALENLYLLSEAKAAWQHYIRLDKSSAWAREADVHLERLTGPRADESWDNWKAELERRAFLGDSATVHEIVKAHPEPVRRHLLGEILPGWAHSSGAPGTSDSLRRVARSIAGALRRVSGNHLLSDAVDAIDRAAAVQDTRRLSALRAGQLALARGIEAHNGWNWAQAETHLTEAERQLAAGGTPLREWAAYYRAVGSYQRTAYDESLQLLDSIQLRSTPQRYLVLWARTAHMRALINEIRGNYSAAFSIRQPMPDVLRGSGDVESLPRQYTSLARLAFILHSDRAAWRYLYEAVKLTPLVTNSRERYLVFWRVADHLSAMAPRVALLYQDEAVEVALSTSNPVVISSAFLARAEFLHRAGEIERARSDLRRAEHHVRDVPSDTTRAIVRADLRLAEAEIESRTAPETALRALAEVIPLFQGTEYHMQLPRAHLAAARAHLALNKYPQADSAFALAIQEMEQQRESAGDYAERAQFQDKARPVFDEMVAFQANRARAAAAFDYFERTRSRALLEQVSAATKNGGRGGGSLASAEIRRRLSKDVVVVSYAVLEKELLVWSITREAVRMARRPISSDTLRSIVNRLETAIIEGAGTADLRAPASVLYRELIEPVGSELSSGARLVIVPDKWLHFLPFAALWDADEGRFLIEEHELIIAPSASLYVQAGRRYRRLVTDKLPRVLAVGNPAFDRHTFRLADLPHAELEASRVAAQYTGTMQLLGPAATKGAFLSHARNVDIIHFAGHAVVRPESPLQSHLVFADDSASGEEGALYARELFEERLANTTLVILSGCHTSSGRLSATEGATSLARAFFAAGVPTVLASLWAVEDESTADFFADYHEHLARTGDPAAALRTTQVEWIRASERRGAVATWGAFQIFGAGRGG